MFSIVIMLLVAAGIVAVVVFGVSVSKYGQDENGGQRMIKSAFQYLVLFATLMMTIGGSVSAFMALADIVSPQPYFQSFESYAQMHLNGKGEPVNQENNMPLDEVTLRKRYDAMVEQEKQNEVARATNNLIKSLGWIVIPLPVFIYYQRRIGKTAS